MPEQLWLRLFAYAAISLFIAVIQLRTGFLVDLSRPLGGFGLAWSRVWAEVPRQLAYVAVVMIPLAAWVEWSSAKGKATEPRPNKARTARVSVEDTATETQDVKLFAVEGRIGRLRYIAYTVGVQVVLFAFAGLIAVVAGLAMPQVVIVLIATLVAVLVMTFMLTIQRSHDFDTTGWLSLLVLVPLVNVLFWFIPGTKGANRFGPPTPPNTGGVYIGAMVLPVIFLGGVLAGIAIPAYLDYGYRAKISEAILQGHEWRTVVAEHHQLTKRLPSAVADLKEAPPSDGRYAHVTLAPEGVIVITLSRQMGSLADKTIFVRPVVMGDELAWNCTGGTLERKYRPPSCRECLLLSPSGHCLKRAE